MAVIRAAGLPGLRSRVGGWQPSAQSETTVMALSFRTPFGLAAYVQTGDAERASRLCRALRAGAVHINGGAYEYGSPFGGYKASGNGREGGVMGLEDFLETKMVHNMP